MKFAVLCSVIRRNSQLKIGLFVGFVTIALSFSSTYGIEFNEAVKKSFQKFLLTNTSSRLDSRDLGKLIQYFDNTFEFRIPSFLTHITDDDLEFSIAILKKLDQKDIQELGKQIPIRMSLLVSLTLGKMPAQILAEWLMMDPLDDELEESCATAAKFLKDPVAKRNLGFALLSRSTQEIRNVGAHILNGAAQPTQEQLKKLLSLIRESKDPEFTSDLINSIQAMNVPETNEIKELLIQLAQTKSIKIFRPAVWVLGIHFHEKDPRVLELYHQFVRHPKISKDSKERFLGWLFEAMPNLECRGKLTQLLEAHRK